MRYLAIDLGGKRTGLAVGDDETGVVTPLRVVEVLRGEALLPISAGEVIVESAKPRVGRLGREARRLTLDRELFRRQLKVQNYSPSPRRLSLGASD